MEYPIRSLIRNSLRFSWTWSLLAAPLATAQMGAGWTQYTPEKGIHLDDAAGLQTFPWSPSRAVGGADYNFDAATGIETFRILDNRSNRSEIRVQNNYTSGKRQLEGEVRTSNPIDGQSVMQVFGGATNATALQIRGFNANGGTFRRYDGEVLATGTFGAWIKLNVIHDADAGRVTIYVNGQQKGSFADRGNATHYFKYGCYGTLRTPAVKTEWRNVKIFRDGAVALLPPARNPWFLQPERSYTLYDFSGKSLGTLAGDATGREGFRKSRVVRRVFLIPRE